jgi:hypothetical protein
VNERVIEKYGRVPQKNIEIWCLTLLLKTGNIVHELVTESFTNQKTRLTIVHERLFSINRFKRQLTEYSDSNSLLGVLLVCHKAK